MCVHDIKKDTALEGRDLFGNCALGMPGPWEPFGTERSEAAQAASSEKGDQYSLFYKKSRREKDDEKIPEETGRGTAGPARSGA